MRAKRSKKYRKTMSLYQRHFSFRAPYQVLLDSHFLRTTHAFHMDLPRYLSNTLHGECRLFVTQCTLAKIQEQHERDKAKVGDKRQGGRPEWLPHPKDVPLRYCKHKNKEGEEVGVLEEGRCLLEMLGEKNKQHFVVATADRWEGDGGRKERGGGRGLELRERVRLVPGVPVVYVKRSVMVLEELSAASERARGREETEKMREGVGLETRKRKRAEEGVEGENEEGDEGGEKGVARRGMAKAKGPNPLSVKKKKVKVSVDGGGEVEEKKKTRRIRGKKKKASAGDGEGTDAAAVDALSD